MKSIIRKIIGRPKKYLIWFANLLNGLSATLQICSRRIIQLVNPKCSNYESEWFIMGRAKLQNDIAKVIKNQKKEYEHYSYFYDYPYQGLAILGVFGERSTEERFEAYKLKDYISQDDRILDIGCNCGFMGVYTSFRTGCAIDGIDINPYAIQIGNLCKEFLKLDKVNLKTCRVQDFTVSTKYTGIFSFATHWTDDKNYRVQLSDHFALIYSMLDKNGVLFFESHSADVGQQSFYEEIEKLTPIFETIYKADTDNGSRHYYVFKKRG